MNAEQRELYQAIITDHDSRPRHFGTPDTFSHRAEGYNPVCGDRYTIYLTLNEDRISEVNFVGRGCALSKASISIMTTLVQGNTTEEALNLFGHFENMLLSPIAADEENLSELSAFEGVRQFPTRIKCAVLGWYTLRAALEGKPEATTE